MTPVDAQALLAELVFLRASVLNTQAALRNRAGASDRTIAPHNQTAPNNSNVMAAILPIVASGVFFVGMTLGATASAATNITVTVNTGADPAMAITSGATAVGANCYVANVDTPGIVFGKAVTTYQYSDIQAIPNGSPSEVMSVSFITGASLGPKGSVAAFALQLQCTANLSGITGAIGIFEMP